VVGERRGEVIKLKFFLWNSGYRQYQNVHSKSTVSTNQNDDVMSPWSLFNEAPDEGKGQLVNAHSSLVSK